LLRNSDGLLNAEGSPSVRFTCRRYIDRVGIVHIAIIQAIAVEIERLRDAENLCFSVT
jgi:hypothetical protein